MGFHLLQRMGITNRTFDKPPVLAPAPVPAATSPSTLLGTLTPPDASAALSAATVAARQAAERARKRATGLGTPTLKQPGLGGPAGVAKPRSLLGA